MAQDTPNWTPDAGCDTPFGLSLRLYQDAWVQMLGLQQAWLASMAEWQQQALSSGWPPQQPWLSWPAWNSGAEHLA